MLYYEQGGWLATVAANDERPLNGQFAVYYVLSVEGTKDVHKPRKMPTFLCVPKSRHISRNFPR